MPRVMNPQEYQQKRGEILDAAQRLIYAKGYEQMSIQDILTELGISKGAFYHYFHSKQDLLEAIVERIMRELEKILTPLTQDPDLPALVKLESFFGSIARWKSTRRPFLNSLLQTWYTDDNAIVRQKVTLAGSRWMAPFLAQIICQGVREGVLDSELNEESAQVVIALMMSMGDGIAAALLSLQPEDGQAARADCLRRIENLTLAYRGAIERVLGAPAGSVSLFNLEILREWVFDPVATPTSPEGQLV